MPHTCARIPRPDSLGSRRKCHCDVVGHDLGVATVIRHAPRAAVLRVWPNFRRA